MRRLAKQRRCLKNNSNYTIGGKGKLLNHFLLYIGNEVNLYYEVIKDIVLPKRRVARGLLIGTNRFASTSYTIGDGTGI
jgi:hypothetical protein